MRAGVPAGIYVLEVKGIWDDYRRMCRARGRDHEGEGRRTRKGAYAYGNTARP